MRYPLHYMGVEWLSTVGQSLVLAHGSFILVRGRGVGAWLKRRVGVFHHFFHGIFCERLRSSNVTISHTSTARCKLGWRNIVEN